MAVGLASYSRQLDEEAQGSNAALDRWAPLRRVPGCHLMPEIESSGFSRGCPSCGRRVPRKVAVCRCGAKIADHQTPLETPTPAAQPAPSSIASPGVITAVALAVVVLAVLWMNRPGPSLAPRVALPAPARAVNQEADSSRVTPALALPAAAPDPAPVPDGALTGSPQPSAPPNLPSLEDVVSRIIPAVVLVETSSGRGSGFFVSADTLITNVHVVGGNSSVTIRRMGGATAPARVSAASFEFDIAVLKISSPAAGQAVISLGSAVNARVGQDVIAIGSALGTLQNTVTRGIVSALRQSGSATLIQTDAAINPGNSGGPLLDRAGVAIGITTMGYSGQQGLNFAVAADHALALLEGRSGPAGAAAVNRGDDFRALSPSVPSATEQVRTAGTSVLEQTLAEIARQGQLMDDYWGQFRKACYEGRVVSAGLDHEWFALLDDRAMQGAVAPGCGPTFADLRKRATDLRAAAIAADEAARQAGIFPGVRRNLRRKYRLDYPGFDR